MSNSKKWLELGLISHLNKEQEIQTEGTKPRKRILGFPGWQTVGTQVHGEIHGQGEPVAVCWCLCWVLGLRGTVWWFTSVLLCRRGSGAVSTNLCPAFRQLGGRAEIFLAPAASRLPSAQNNPDASVACVGGVFCSPSPCISLLFVSLWKGWHFAITCVVASPSARIPNPLWQHHHLGHLFFF